MIILENNYKNMSDREIIRIIELTNIFWPPADGVSAGYKKELKWYRDTFPDCETFLVYGEDKELIAHTRLIIRDIFAENLKLKILGIGALCVNPEHQSKGVGSEIIKRCFTLVDEKRYDLALFRTDIPEYYLKLGAKIVNNKFYNSKNSENRDQNPWNSEDIIMIYSKHTEWPAGEIDLNGDPF